MKYSIKTGIWKTIKNVAIVIGIPTLVLFLDSWTEIIPIEWHKFALPIIGLVSYFVKNYLENK
ncbi:MAG: hypothetical protein IMZ51_04065 [Chloroflexi bacterium]|nr:hypothetical protein [Chloroflexota bacterium]